MSRLRSLLTRLRVHATGDRGFGMVELLIAMAMLSIAVGALTLSFASSAVSLRRAGQKGTALTLADTQMEKYRTKTFTAVRIDGTLIPTSGTYVTANSTDSTIPPSTNQALAGQNGASASATRAGFEAFIERVQALIEAGVLDAADGYLLIEAAAAIGASRRSAAGTGSEIRARQQDVSRE
jgi:prepilin-type N-terminal cleavage/methylation domain-containing protein